MQVIIIVVDTIISIHALLAESDRSGAGCLICLLYFYPRSPCGERQLCFIQPPAVIVFLSTLSLRRATCSLSLCRIRPLFLSTLSLRRATCGCCGRCRYWGYFYPRSPCGERPNPRQNQHQRKHISIHALLAESDARRALGFVDPDISIHALLAESDSSKTHDRHKTRISIHALLAESDG